MLIRKHTSQPGQALVVVALTLGVLISLIVGTNVAVRCLQIRARVQYVLDDALGAAVVESDHTALLHSEVQIVSEPARHLFDLTLTAELARLAAEFALSPPELTGQSKLEIISGQSQCGPAHIHAPALCASLTLVLPALTGDVR